MTALQQPAAPSWRRTAEQQDGVLSREQALAGGVTPSAWRHRTRTRWRLLLPGVALLADAEPTDRQRAWAAVLHGGDGTALSGRAALVLDGCDLRLPALDLAVPHERRVVRVPAGRLGLAVVPHRVVRLAELVHPVRSPRRVRPAAAALHGCAWAASASAGETVLAVAVQQRLVTPRGLAAALLHLPRLPRRALVRDVVEDLERGVQARSELQLVRLLRQAGLPLPDVLQRVVRTGQRRYVLDGWYERQRVAVEVDGAHHRDVETWEADVLRSNEVGLAHPGALLLRFTTALLRHRSHVVVDQLGRALSR